MAGKLVLGIDFGSDSARSILVDARSGHIVANGMAEYARWKDGLYCRPQEKIYRQHPQDHIDALVASVKAALAAAPPEAARDIAAIGVDATASTPSPISANGRPLCLEPEFHDDPDAMFHLWKEHAAHAEAKEITQAFRSAKVDYTRYQGVYNSEWCWAKMLRTIRRNPAIKAAVTWMELADWIPALLSGGTTPGQMYRNSSTAGHKMYWRSEFGGLPDQDCLSSLDPYLAMVGRTFEAPAPADSRVGTLTPEWAERLGLPAGIVVGGSVIDGIAGGIGAGIGPNVLVKVVGTSNGDLLVVDKAAMAAHPVTSRICGQAEDSVFPGFIGLETGQAAFGDVYAWFRRMLLWPLEQLVPTLGVLDDVQAKRVLEAAEKKLLPFLNDAAAALPDNGRLIAIETINGRREPGLNEHLRGGVYGLTGGTTTPEFHRGLIVATVLGAKRIFTAFIDAGLRIDRVIACGGISRKAPFIMQLMADALDRPVDVCDSAETCALGAAICAAAAAGLHPDIQAAQQVMAASAGAGYRPDPDGAADMNRRLALYDKFDDFAHIIDPA